MSAQEKILNLSICATNRCNRCCKHCMVSATNNGEDFAKRFWIRKLMRQAKDLGYTVNGSITGTGEPLMHPRIVQLADAFVGLKICRAIGFATSGFLEKDKEEKQKFQALLDRQFKSNIIVRLSFNLYNSTFPERLTQTLGLILSQDGVSFTDIDVTCDRKNYFTTLNTLYETLACIGVRFGTDINSLTCEITDELFKSMYPKFLNQEFSEENRIQLVGDSTRIPCIHKTTSKNFGHKYLCINVFLTEPTGFAKNMPNDCFSYNTRRFKCNEILLARDTSDKLLISPDGSIFASCNCLIGNLPIGTWKTPLADLISRKKQLQEKLMCMVLIDKSLKWSDRPCEECATFAKRNLSFD